jgi:hypothetical protein
MNFYSIKSTNSRHVVLHEQETNDLVILDKFGQEVSRLQGKQRYPFEQTYLRSGNFTDEHDYMIWFSGTSSVCVVDMKDLSFIEIKKCLPDFQQSSSSVPLRCVARNKGDDLAIYYTFDNSNFFCYYSRGAQPVRKQAVQVLPNCKVLHFSNLIS